MLRCNGDAAILAVLLDAGDPSNFFHNASEHEGLDNLTKHHKPAVEHAER
jgi:hypothetical protein